MIIPLGVDDIQSHDENAARIRLENMYLIDSPLSPDGISRVSRPTLNTVANVGLGPVSGMFREDGSIGGMGFVVSDSTLYKTIDDATFFALGSVGGAGYCDFSGSEDRVLILRDGVVYSTDGVTITTVAMPDNVLVSSVAYIDGFFLLGVKDTEKFYWISPGLTDPDPLDFASAERLPDNIVSITIISDEIWFLGQSSVEVWVASGNSDAPFQRVSGRAYSYGCLTNDSVVTSSYKGYPCGIWVTPSGIVIMAQGQPQRISNQSVEEILRSATNTRAWSFEYNRDQFYILTCDQATFAFDFQKGTWSRWSSYLLDNWKAHLGYQRGSTIISGSYLGNNVYSLSEGVSDDDDPIIRTVSGLVIFQGNYMNCSRVNVLMNVGWTDSYGPPATLELRWSDDLGQTYGNYVAIPIGEKGNYRTDACFSGLGMIRRPGRLFQFRFSDKTRFRIDYATMNEM